MLQQNNVVVPTNNTSENLHFLEVKPSNIQGVGLFTGVNLAAGTILFEIKGEHIVHAEYDPYLADKNSNWMGIGYCEWIKFDENDNGLYINHSCDPNVIVNDKLQLITFKPIKANEELTMDYSTTELDPDWMMHCNCGQDNCRKILRGFQFLPQSLQEKYGKVIAPIYVEIAKKLQPVTAST